jgi:hypothetical protein
MEVILGAAITLATLLVTTVLSRVGARADARAKAKQEAADQLAEYGRHVWDKGREDSWLNLQTYLTRLRGPLHRAGVPTALYQDFRAKALAMWEDLDWVDEEHGWGSSHGKSQSVEEAADLIYRVLEAKPPWWRRALS